MRARRGETTGRIRDMQVGYWGKCRSQLMVSKCGSRRFLILRTFFCSFFDSFVAPLEWFASSDGFWFDELKRQCVRWVGFLVDWKNQRDDRGWPDGLFLGWRNIRHLQNITPTKYKMEIILYKIDGIRHNKVYKHRQMQERQMNWMARWGRSETREWMKQTTSYSSHLSTPHHLS